MMDTYTLIKLCSRWLQQVQTDLLNNYTKKQHHPHHAVAPLNGLCIGLLGGILGEMKHFGKSLYKHTISTKL